MMGAVFCIVKKVCLGRSLGGRELNILQEAFDCSDGAVIKKARAFARAVG